MNRSGILTALRFLCLALALGTAAHTRAQSESVGTESTEGATEDAPPEAQADPDSNAGEDYEASEQISEDLSVSFPIDI